MGASTFFSILSFERNPHMICCALLSGVIALLLWLSRRVSPRGAAEPLAWRPYGASGDCAPVPAFSPRARLKSFSYAIAGLRFMLRTQHNAWIHAMATLVVVAAGLALRIEADDWRWLVAALVFVWVAETMNTAFEHVCNVVSPRFSLSVQHAKDVAAGAVLISAAGAALIGASVLMPYVAAATR